MMIRFSAFARLLPAAAFAVMMPALLAPAAAAQPAQSTPNALQGFSKSQGQPIKIESVSLEVRDKDKVATFIDNVKLVQGDTTLECKRLIVYYDEEATPGAKKGKPAAKPVAKKGAEPAAGQQQQIRKLEAKGGVVVTSKDQIATGDDGTYDMKSNTIVMTGNVTLTQGQNVVRGQKLFVDMGTGISRVEAAPGQGRVDALFLPQSREKPEEKNKPGETHNGETGKTNGRATTSDKPKSGAQKPMKLN
jgi:lipopolysaccharide export system protein LptA